MGVLLVRAISVVRGFSRQCLYRPPGSRSGQQRMNRTRKASKQSQIDSPYQQRGNCGPLHRELRSKEERFHHLSNGHPGRKISSRFVPNFVYRYSDFTNSGYRTNSNCALRFFRSRLAYQFRNQIPGFLARWSSWRSSIDFNTSCSPLRYDISGSRSMDLHLPR